jgi:hypothetical protein
MAMALIGLWVFELFLEYLVYKVSQDFFTGRTQFGLPNSSWTVPPSILVLALAGIQKIPWQVRLGFVIAYVFTVTVIIAAGEVSAAWWIDGRRFDGLPWVSMWILLVPIVIAIPWRRQIGRGIFLSAIPPLVLYHRRGPGRYPRKHDVPAQERSSGGATARELPARGTDRQRRHGRSLACQP